MQAKDRGPKRHQCGLIADFQPRSCEKSMPAVQPPSLGQSVSAAQAGQAPPDFPSSSRNSGALHPPGLPRSPSDPTWTGGWGQEPPPDTDTHLSGNQGKSGIIPNHRSEAWDQSQEKGDDLCVTRATKTRQMTLHRYSVTARTSSQKSHRRESSFCKNSGRSCCRSLARMRHLSLSKSRKRLATLLS